MAHPRPLVEREVEVPARGFRGRRSNYRGGGQEGPFPMAQETLELVAEGSFR